MELVSHLECYFNLTIPASEKCPVGTCFSIPIISNTGKKSILGQDKRAWKADLGCERKKHQFLEVGSLRPGLQGERDWDRPGGEMRCMVRLERAWKGLHTHLWAMCSGRATSETVVGCTLVGTSSLP
jgi:hypothetical protein